MRRGPVERGSYYLWEFRKDGVVDAEKIETAKERAEARAAAAKAPTLADAMMLATMDPITIEEIVAALSALGRADATEPAVREVLAHEGPRFARIQAADGRALYIRRRNAGPKRVPIVVYLTRPDGAALRRRHHPQRTEGGGANATTA